MILLLILGTILCLNETIAQKINVNCKIEFTGSYKPDSIFVSLQATSDNFFETIGNPPNPIFFSRVSGNKMSFEAEPGIYMIGCAAWKYSHAFRLIYLNPELKSIDIKFVMNPLPIGYGHISDNIKKVELRGQYNNFDDSNKVQLEKEDKIWKLTKIPSGLKIGQRYNFVINEEITDDLLNNNFVYDKNWIAFSNIYVGNEIIFDPLVYGKPENLSEVEIKNPSAINKQIMSLTTELNNFSKSYKEMVQRIDNSKYELTEKSADSIFVELSNIEKKYDAEFKQLFIERSLEIQDIKMLSAIPSIRNTTSIEQLKEILDSKNFGDYLNLYIDLLNDLDPNSYFLNGNFMNNMLVIKSIIRIYPEVLSKHDLPSDYFDDFIYDFVDNSKIERLKCVVLYQLAIMENMQNEEKIEKTLDKLAEYDYNKYVPSDRVNSLMAQLNIKIGKQAPDFSISTLEGENLKLSDFKGKFVFVDFWGSWCPPCITEIPNIKNLYSKVSPDKLVILGLAGNDTEESLKNCISNNGIEYPNAMASPTLLSTYGINKFPTSFLINPEGRIVRIDMRGEDELNLIADEIDHYFK